jgi:hypothetical protein
MLQKRKIKSQTMVITVSKDVITDKAISLLNFSNESLTTWTEVATTSGDLAAFLSELYNESAFILSKEGEIFHLDESTRKNITDRTLEEGINTSSVLAKKFTLYEMNSFPAPAAARTYKKIDPDYFLHNKVFGKTLKYLVAWKNICGCILAESAFFSQAHLLEARTDIDACLEMAAQFYYKQSFQILRGFLENAVLPVYFCDRPNEFEKWRSNNYHTPPLRGKDKWGKDGILNSLEKSGLITNELSKNVSSLYGQLNGSIHGTEKYLIHKGVHKNAWSGLLFKEQDFLNWCTAISKSVELGAKLLQINVKQLMSLRGLTNTVCTTCHNDKNLKLEEFIFGGRNFKRYSCHICGHQSTFDDDGNLSHTLTEYE